MTLDALAGMLCTPDGTLERPVVAEPLRVPEFMEIEGDRLIYSWYGDRDRIEHGWAPPARKMLEDFLALADGPTPRILAFAHKWGPLYICERHGLPLSHALQTSGGMCLAPEVEWRPDWYWEPLAAWHRYAGLALGCLHVAAALRDGKPGDGEDWERINTGLGALLPVPVPQSRGWDPVEWQQTLLPHIADYWLTQLAHVGLRIVWDPEVGGPAIKLVGERSELFGALGLQLVFAMSGTGGFVTCSGCGTPYSPRRQPPARRRHYCPECGRKAAVREAQIRFRAEHPDYYAARKRRARSAKPRGAAARVGRNA
jgi:hypothetical protein